jgi:hypothetical protein
MNEWMNERNKQIKLLFNNVICVICIECCCYCCFFICCFVIYCKRTTKEMKMKLKWNEMKWNERNKQKEWWLSCLFVCEIKIKDKR